MIRVPLPVETLPNLPDDLARDWFGLGTWALIVSGFIVALKILYKLKSQIVNGHPQPLRSDLDDMRDEIKDSRDEVRVARDEVSAAINVVLGLVGEVRAERAERRADVQELHVKLDDVRKALPGG